MTPEERWTKIENAIQDLTAVQAEHAVQIEKQNVGIRDLAAATRLLLDSVGKLRDGTGEGFERLQTALEAERQERKMALEAERQERQKALESARAERQEAHREMDERLTILLKIVDGMIRRNGRGES